MDMLLEQEELQEVEDLSRIRALWAAVMRQSLVDWLEGRVGRVPLTNSNYIMANHYIFHGAESFNSFDNICHFLGWNPDRIKSKITARPREVYFAFLNGNSRGAARAKAMRLKEGD